MHERTVCLLGGTGFVGGHLTTRLANQGWRVRLLTRNAARHRALKVLPTVRIVQGDVYRPEFLRQPLGSVSSSSCGLTAAVMPPTLRLGARPAPQTLIALARAIRRRQSAGRLLLSKAGARADDFHQLQLDRLAEPIEVVEVDELHAPLASPKKGKNPLIALLADRVGDAAARGFTWLWPQRHDS